MTKESAIQQLDELKQRNKLSVEEVLQAYRLSVALDDGVQASYFENLYEDLRYASYLDIALNITNPEYRELFFQKYEDFGWIPNFYCLAIIIKQKDQIPNYEEFEKIFSEDPETLEYIHNSDYFTKSIDEIKEMLLEGAREYEQQLIHRRLDRFGRMTKDIAIAERILDEVCINKIYDNSDRSWIHENILNLLMEKDPDEAVRYYHKIQKVCNSWTKWAFAKTIYKYRPSCSNMIIPKLGEHYSYLFQIFIAMGKNLDEKDIKSRIDSVDLALKRGEINDKTYNDAIGLIGYAIVDKYPLLAYSLIEKGISDHFVAYDFQEYDAKPSFVYGLQESLAEYFFAKGEIDLGLEHYHEVAKSDLLARIIQKTDDQAVLSALVPLADSFDDIGDLRQIYKELYKKGLVPFDKMYQLASAMMPDDYYYEDDPEFLYQNYEGYFAF